jgi:hypothetical protein
VGPEDSPAPALQPVPTKAPKLKGVGKAASYLVLRPQNINFELGIRLLREDSLAGRKSAEFRASVSRANDHGGDAALQKSRRKETLEKYYLCKASGRIIYCM